MPWRWTEYEFKNILRTEYKDMTPFPSKFDNTCYKCNQQIKKGQMITWSRTKKGMVSHSNCPVEVKVEIAPEEAPTRPQLTHGTEANPLQEMAKFLSPYLQHAQTEAVLESLRKELEQFKKKLMMPLTVRVEKEEKEPKEIKGAHNMMPHLLYFISKGHHVYLWGPPGSGKSTAASQVASALGLQWGYLSLNPQTPDSRVLGFMDANGTYRHSLFHTIYTQGGVFCIDEMDNASPSLLTTLNSMLENGHGAFPNGLAPRHKDFCLVATGNTSGRGANPSFPERRPFDSAFQERFTFLEWDYDQKLEKAVTLAINPDAEPWLEWVWGTRKYCLEHYPRIIVSPRVSFKGAEYIRDVKNKKVKLTLQDILDALLFRGLDKATVLKIMQANNLPGGLI